MPTHSIRPKEDQYGIGGKLSHSQKWSHGLCPRAWFYEREYGWRNEAHPVLVFGHAVEEAVCRVLRESPALISINASTEVMDSPTLEVTQVYGRRDSLATHIDQRPESEDKWKGPSLLWLGGGLSGIDELRNWAHARVDVHWPRAVATAHERWSQDPNRIGDWDEFMLGRGGLGPLMAKNALDMHLEEVQACMDAGGGPNLQAWRDTSWSTIATIPAPSGFPEYWDKPHPVAQKGADVSLLEAWELARPWFVDPEAGAFTQQAMLPDGWFQGEYDLVYRWEGTPRIVDLKASEGTSEWAAAYPIQMETYAWLWWASHGKGEQVSGLETWYMGPAIRKTYPLPDKDRLQELEDELHLFWQKHTTTRGNRNIADYPPEPAPVPAFAAGGGEKERELPPEVRCKRCAWASECEASGVAIPHHEGDEHKDVLGNSYPLAEVGKVAGRVNLHGTITSWKTKAWQHGGVQPAFGIWTDNSSIWITSYKGGPEQVPTGVGNGSKVRVEGAFFATKKDGSMMLKLDDKSRIIPSEKPAAGDEAPTGLSRINIRGRVMSLQWAEGSTGWGSWQRWGLSLSTADGPIEVSAMNVFPFGHDEVLRGEEVIILDAYATAFGEKTQAACDENTRLIILR